MIGVAILLLLMMMRIVVDIVFVYDDGTNKDDICHCCLL